MKFKFLTAATAAIAISAGAAGAATVDSTQILAVDGQDMDFSFGGLDASNGTGGTVLITPMQGQGTLGLDLSGAFPAEDENFEVTFDGGSQGFFSCNGPSNNGSTAIAGATDNSFNFNDCMFSLVLNVGAGLLDSILADGTFDVGVYFGDDVSTFGDDDVVSVTLRYESIDAVPLPASLGFLSVGLAAFGFASRKRKS